MNEGKALPADILCECCSKVLRDPVVKAKHGTQGDTGYFHEKCFKEQGSRSSFWNSQYVLFESKQFKDKCSPLSAKEAIFLGSRLEECGFSLNEATDEKMKDAHLRIALFAHLDTLNGILSGKKSVFSEVIPLNADAKLKMSALQIDEETGEMKIQVEDLNRAQIPHAHLTLENKLSASVAVRTIKYGVAPGAVAGVATAKMMVVAPVVEGAKMSAATMMGLTVFSAVAVIGVLGVYGGQYVANTFRTNTESAIKKAKERQFAEAEKMLSDEFEGRYALTKMLRWTATQYNEYSVAHLIRGQCALELKSEKAYVHFKQAYEDAKDDTLRGVTLLNLIRMLAPESKVIIKESNGTQMSKAVREKIFEEKLKELQDRHSVLVQNFYKQVIDFSQVLLSSIAHWKHDLHGQLHKANAEDISRFKEAYIFRYIPGLGRKVEVVFVFLQGVLHLLSNMHKGDEVHIKAAELKFNRCWEIIRLQKMQTASKESSEYKIAEAIQSFITIFIQSPQVRVANPQLDVNKWLSDRGLVH